MGLTGSMRQTPAAGRMLIVPLLLLSFVSAVIILGLAGDAENGRIDILQDDPVQVINPFQENPGQTFSIKLRRARAAGLNGNAATDDLILFSLIAGLVAIASTLVGLHHVRLWTSASLGAAQSAALIALLLLMLPLASACKEIHFGGRGVELITLESFVIILTGSHLLYSLLLYSGSDHFDLPGGDHHPIASTP